MNRFVFNCKHCNWPLEAGEDLVGLELQCIYCFKSLVVPSPAPAATSTATPTATPSPTAKTKVSVSPSVILRAKNRKKTSFFRSKKIIVALGFLVVLVGFFSWYLFFKRSFSLETAQKILKECDFVLESPEPVDGELNYVKCKSYLYYYPDKFHNTFIRIYIDFDGKFIGFSGKYSIETLDRPSNDDEKHKDFMAKMGSFKLNRFIQDFTGLKSSTNFIDIKEMRYSISPDLSYPYDGGSLAYVENNKFHYEITTNGYLSYNKVHFTHVAKVLFILNK